MRGEVFLELRNQEPPPPSALSLTMAQRAVTIYAIPLSSHLMRDCVLDRKALTSAPGVTSALKSSADMPWRTDAP